MQDKTAQQIVGVEGQTSEPICLEMALVWMLYLKMLKSSKLMKAKETMRRQVLAFWSNREVERAKIKSTKKK